MPHLVYPHPPTDPVPPIPPRTRSRASSQQRQCVSVASHQPKASFFRLDELPVPDREWQLLENIGDGTYGEVFRAKHIRNPDFYAAVKIMHPTNEVLEEIEQEYRVLFELSSHENLCRFYGAYLKRAPAPPLPPPPPPRNPIDKTSLLSVETNSTNSLINPALQLDQLWLVMELCTSGSVTDLAKSILKANQRLDESLIAYILRETFKALHHLHSNNVIHRDVKGHNILITGDGHIKLIDFGVSAYLSPFHGRRNTSVGTPFFMAPEVIACERQVDYDYDTRADVWSTGITAIEIAEGEPPLAEMHPMRALVSIPRNPPPCLRQSHDWSPEFNDFIRLCLIKNFEARPAVAQMLIHPFLAQIPSDGIEARRRIVQIVQRYKPCYDLCMKKTSRETCGVKNGHIRGKSETCSSVAIEGATAMAAVCSPPVECMIPPPKRLVPIVGKVHHPTHESHKRAAPPPPINIENGHATHNLKTKRKSQSRRHQKQLQINSHDHRSCQIDFNDDLPVCHPSLKKKTTNKTFFNSTYDSMYPIVPQPNSYSTDDLAQLETFDEQSIMSFMYHRFLSDQIYTYIGDILVAVNPFHALPIYGKDVMVRYRASIKSEQPPHIYALADLTYQAMLHDLENQYIVISGESGSGKTQSANFLVKQLTFLGHAPNKHLQEKILQINPLIEGFGNARTIINDNSSRFGKYLEMLFTKEGRVTGARLSEYLLEKSRVVNQGRAERNFHIFYYLLHGLASSAPNDQKAFYLSKNHVYRYLKTDFDDQEDLTDSCQVKFRTIEKCFEIIGFHMDEVKSIYRILAGLLHLGNIDFHQNEGHFIDGKTCLTDRYLLQIVCELFGLDCDELDLALTTCNIVTRGETIQRSTTLQESQSTRDAMAKALYNRLFSWIVNRISALLAPSAVALKDMHGTLTDDESSVQSYLGNYNKNNNNNNNPSDLSDDELSDGDEITKGVRLRDEMIVTATYPPPKIMCAMRRTLDYLDMTPSSSPFLLHLQQSEEDDDDDDDEILYLNTNNNNNNSSSNPSPPPNAGAAKNRAISHRKSGLINDLNSHSFVEHDTPDEKPVPNMVNNWSRVMIPTSSSPSWMHMADTAAATAKTYLVNRATSESNLGVRKTTIGTPMQKPYQSTSNLFIHNKQALSLAIPSTKPATMFGQGNKDAKKDDQSEALKIAILDIFGFENFSTNTFEQLCINIANEQIQYHFNQHVFACEKQEYINENLSVLPLPAKMDLTFYDNRPLLEMFLNKPVGILALIDEESRFPKATDYTLVDKLNANFSSSPLYIRSKSSFSSSSISFSSASTPQSIPSFSIIHFAGQVQYDARGFLEKNRDYLAPDIIQILRSSRVQLISSLFHLSLSKTGTIQEPDLQRPNSGGPPAAESLNPLDINHTLIPLNASHNRVQATVSTYFRYSLTDLFSKMVHGSPKFVRCFKPNNDRIPGCFDAQTVLEQLKYSGILAAAKIRRYGFSHRIPFESFIQRYSILVYPSTTNLPITRETCEHILHKLKMQNWTIGKSKVFLKYYHAEQLTRLHSNMLNAIITIQSYARMRSMRSRLKHLRYRHSNDMMIEELHRHPKFSRTTVNTGDNVARSIVYIQSCIRGYLQRRRYRQLKNKPRTYDMAAAIIQKCYRGFRFRRVFGHYRQRLDTQMLCFLQQIEFINNDFFTKIVRTNYCVSLKAIESLPSPRPHVNNHRQSSKPLHYFFPPPPPLPLPSPFSVGGPTSAAPEASAHLKNLPPISLVPTPPPPPPLPPPAATFFPARHRVYRSPSPSTSKFAQVRDMFVRGEGSAVSASGGVSTTTIIHAQPPTKHPPSSSQTLPSIDQSRSPKALTVLNAVQEYQRQHINNHQQASKRFSHLGIGGSVNGVRPAHVGNQRSRATIQSNCNLPKPQIKQCLSMQAAPSPKQQQQQQQQQQSAKPITREHSMSTQPKYPFHVLLRKTGQDLSTGHSIAKRRLINETKQVDFRSVLKPRQSMNGTHDNETIMRSNSLTQPSNVQSRMRINDF